MLRFPVQPKPFGELKKMAEPQAVRGGQAEALAWVLFDTATYVSATTTVLQFFTASRDTRQLTNMNNPGTLPDPQYFQIEYFGLDVLAAPQDGAWADVHDLLMGGTDGGPTWEFSLADKSYGQFPVTFLHESGGVQGFGFSTLTDDAEEYARNARPDGGWCVDGSIVIPPQQSFSITLRWSSAQTLENIGDTDLRAWMAGSLYRRVL